MSDGLPRVEIEWLDAYSGLNETSVKRASRNKPITTFSIGYLISESDEGLTIVSDQWPGYPDKGFAEHFVGWGMVKNWWYLIER